MGRPTLEEFRKMAPQKYYTVDCKNKFAAFDSDGGASSGDEVVLMKAPADREQQQDARSPVKERERIPKESEGEPRVSRRIGAEREGGGGGRGGRMDGAERGYRGGRGHRGTGDGFVGGPPRGAFRGGYGGGDRDGRVSLEEHGDEEVRNRSPRSLRAKDFEVERERDHGAAVPRGRGRGRWIDKRREFDRRSGTGRSRDTKKEGGGGHNWGNEEEDWGGSGVKSPTDESKVELPPDVSIDEGGAEEKEDTEREKPAELNGTAAVEIVENAEEKEKAAKAKIPEKIDLQEYKRMQEMKRANLPSIASGKPRAKISTEKDLEAQGYARYVKAHSGDEAEGAEEEEVEGGGADGQAQKKKTLNVFEYIHNEGGQVHLFPDHRHRGSAKRRGRGREGTVDCNDVEDHRAGRGKHKGKDAPDLGDERAFPKLG